MTPQIVPLPTFQGVSSNANQEVQATTKIPPGLLLRKIILAVSVAAGNKTLDQILNDIRLTVDGKDQRIATATEIDSINSRNGEKYALSTSGSIGAGNLVSYLTLFLLEPWRSDPLSNNGRLYAWNLNGVDGVSIKANIKTGLTTPLLAGFYEYEPVIGNQGFGPLVKWLRKDFGPTATPVDVPDIFNLQQPNRLHSLHLFPTTGGQYVNKVSLKFDSTLYLDQVDYLTQQANLNAYGLTPDAGATPRFDVELDQSDSLSDTLLLQGKISQNAKLDFSAGPSGNMHIISQLFGPKE